MRLARLALLLPWLAVGCGTGSVDGDLSIEDGQELSEMRARASCSVAPNPVSVGAQLTVTGHRLRADTTATVEIDQGVATSGTSNDCQRSERWLRWQDQTPGPSNATDVPTGEDGTCIAKAQATTAGRGLVQIWAPSRHGKLWAVARCTFTVTDAPSASTPSASTCGDGTCDSAESCSSCPTDCGACPTSCTYAYSAWGACQSNGTQTRTVISATPASCTGTPVLSQSCTYTQPPPSTCTYTYSAWGACQSNGAQTRTVISATPASCTGTPVLSQSCTYTQPPPSTCTYTYSAWGACQSNGAQTRTVISATPASCTGTPVLSQSCTYTAPSCTYAYSAWGACQSSGTQTRTVVSLSPAGCTGAPVLSQSCTYSAPIDAAGIYAQKCASCHHPLASSDMKGKTVNQFLNYHGTMGLSSAEIQAVMDLLK